MKQAIPPRLHEQGCVGETEPKVPRPLGEDAHVGVQLRVDKEHLRRKYVVDTFALLLLARNY